MGKVKAVNDFGLDAEIAARRNANYPQQEEDEAIAWIESVLGITFDKDFAEMLQDGKILCQLGNACVPSRPIKKIYEGTMPFKLRENVSAFIRVCRDIGVPEGDLFTTEACFECKDPASVVLGLFAFSRALQTNKSVNYNGPILGRQVGAKGVMTGFKEVNLNSTTSALNAGSSSTMEATKATFVREQIVRGDLGASVDPNATSALNSGSSSTMDQSAHAHTESRGEYYK